MMHWCCLSRSCDPTLAMPKLPLTTPEAYICPLACLSCFCHIFGLLCLVAAPATRLLNTGETSILACHTLAALQTGSIWEP